jgi:hypothetical protein
MILRDRMAKSVVNEAYREVGWPDDDPRDEMEVALKAMAAGTFPTRRFCDVDAVLTYAFFANKTDRKDRLVPASRSEIVIDDEQAFYIEDLLRSSFARNGEDLLTRGRAFADQVLKMDIVGLRTRALRECLAR